MHVENRIKDISYEFIPRTYTLTHSDKTGDLFLTIDRKFDKKQIASFYTRFMRDEVLGEWVITENKKYNLYLYLHISGGIVFGWARMREKIFRSHMSLVLKVIRYGDDPLFQKMNELDYAEVIVFFQSPRKAFNKQENYGKLKKFKI